jgi:hypothetical protein
LVLFCGRGGVDVVLFVRGDEDGVVDGLRGGHWKKKKEMRIYLVNSVGYACKDDNVNQTSGIQDQKF